MLIDIVQNKKRHNFVCIMMKFLESVTSEESVYLHYYYVFLRLHIFMLKLFCLLNVSMGFVFCDAWLPQISLQQKAWKVASREYSCI